MTDVGMSRRGALGALAAFTAAPAIALPAPVDAANALWAQRQKHVVRLLQLSHEYNAAHVKLPACGHVWSGAPGRKRELLR
jgi:hypothetical protein